VSNQPSVPQYPQRTVILTISSSNTDTPKGITEFEAARNAKSPSCFNWDSDKCTLSPDRPAKFNFVPSCHRHDFGCTNFEKKNQWNPVNKARTDWNFRTDMLDECAKYKGFSKLAKRALCTVLANKYAEAVFAFNPPTDL
jgi:hypothetical protein